MDLFITNGKYFVPLKTPVKGFAKLNGIINFREIDLIKDCAITTGTYNTVYVFTQNVWDCVAVRKAFNILFANITKSDVQLITYPLDYDTATDMYLPNWLEMYLGVSAVNIVTQTGRPYTTSYQPSMVNNTGAPIYNTGYMSHLAPINPLYTQYKTMIIGDLIPIIPTADIALKNLCLATAGQLIVSIGGATFFKAGLTLTYDDLIDNILAQVNEINTFCGKIKINQINIDLRNDFDAATIYTIVSKLAIMYPQLTISNSIYAGNYGLITPLIEQITGVDIL